MKVMGIIVVKHRTEEPEGLGFINPEHPYLVIEPDQADDDTWALCHAIVMRGDYTPVGIVLDPETDLDPTLPN